MKKLNFLLFILILLLFSPNNLGAAASCYDSDGRYDYDTKGSTEDREYSRTDFCEDNRLGGKVDVCTGEYCVLREYYCGSDDAIKESIYHCPNGCKNGRCANISESEITDSNFYLNIKYPNNGEKLEVGKTYRITWEQKNVYKVSIGYKDSSLDWITENYSIDPNQTVQSYEWTIPANLVGTNAFLYIGYYDADNKENGIAVSQKSFSIVGIGKSGYQDDGQNNNQTEQDLGGILINNDELYERLKGKILLKVEDDGRAYYVHPSNKRMYYLGTPAEAFEIMRNQGVGITNDNILKIGAEITELSGPDEDGDGLSDLFEDAIGTKKDVKDTDGDGFDDKSEIVNGYNPTDGSGGKLSSDSAFSEKQKGKIFLQVERNGEAWYINPKDAKRYFLGRPADAFLVMRSLSLGISNKDFDAMK
jgi:hypothetical protein